MTYIYLYKSSDKDFILKNLEQNFASTLVFMFENTSKIKKKYIIEHLREKQNIQIVEKNIIKAQNIYELCTYIINICEEYSKKAHIIEILEKRKDKIIEEFDKLFLFKNDAIGILNEILDDKVIKCLHKNNVNKIKNSKGYLFEEKTRSDLSKLKKYSEIFTKTDIVVTPDDFIEGVNMQNGNYYENMPAIVDYLSNIENEAKYLSILYEKSDVCINGNFYLLDDDYLISVEQSLAKGLVHKHIFDIKDGVYHKKRTNIVFVS